MDTEIYSEAVINRFLKKNLFFNDPVLEKYYRDNNLAAFRKRVHRLHKNESFEKIVYAIVTDTIRDIVLKTVGDLSEFLKSMGDLVISGGEAFNMYLERKDRLITSDIDTKFIPRIPYDSKYFGKLQAIKLLLWNKLGEPSKGDIFIDVELFALDLNLRYFSVQDGKITKQILGGILDIPFMRPKEFGYEVIESKKAGVTYKNKNTNAMIHDKRIYVAGKRFLLDDVYLMQKLGLRPEKKEKDRQRMYKLSKLITKVANIKPSDDINTIYEHTHNKIKSLRKQTIRPTRVNMSLAAKVNPYRYQEYTTKPQAERISKQIVYGVKTSVPNINIPGFSKTHGNQRFNLKKQEWVKNTSKNYVKNEFNYRPTSAKKLPEYIEVSKLLYGYRPARDKWVSPIIIKKSAQIPFVGLKN